MVRALEVLGYDRVYHMSSCITSPQDQDVWRKAIMAKWYGEGKPFSRADWDVLLGDCMARYFTSSCRPIEPAVKDHVDFSCRS